ncbi:Eco57I restriction-modification methylase domain-containing protein [Parasutterella secunda]|uniref:Eco57I restriction-modification methylase domain-containing protein n=1 Tax=Parasutterella secunda TaxID=626947 RepID=UPI0024B386A7|nr:N-6 DNA methylase [Parasutterella secunda]
MQDSFCSYYTNSYEITSYMVEMLDLHDNDIILEPAAGEGAFIDRILTKDVKVQIDALDIDKNAINILEKKYKHHNSVCVRNTDTLLDEKLDSYSVPELWLKQTDTLLDNQLDLFALSGGHYSKIIGNPPYGAWQDHEKRALLKKKYRGHYVKETYSLFLLRCVSLLRMHGKLSFIIPDTFLFLNLHARLRSFLLKSTKLSEILIFPSKFFPGVNFGYSNLSIITLERATQDEALNNTVKVIRGFKSPKEFESLLEDNKKKSNHLEYFYLTQKEILENEQQKVILANTKIQSLLSNVPLRLGDVSDVVTGFYSGDNKRFVKVANENIKGSKNYILVDPDKVSDCRSIEGIKNVSESYIPYIKGASERRYYKDPFEWYIRWDKGTVDFYAKNKTTRFQNPSFYFKTGIGIPMVKSSTIKAFLMDGHVFDQSIVGIFPKNEQKLFYFLALMNSSIINELIHILNPTANNSANYIKLLPYIEPNKDQLEKINEKVIQLLDYENTNSFELADAKHEEIDAMIGQIYSNRLGNS